MASNKPPAVQAAVVAKRMNGDSKRQIAADLEINRATVTRILNDAEIDNFVQDGKSRLYELIPKAVKSYSNGVEKSAVLAGDFLQRMTVLPDTGQSGNNSGPSIQIVTNVQMPPHV